MMFNILLVKSESHPPSSTYSNKMTTKAHFQPTQKLVSVQMSSDTDAFISHTHTHGHNETHIQREGHANIQLKFICLNQNN